MFCGGVQFYPVQSEMSNKSSLFISMFCNLLWNPTPKSSNPGHGGGNPQNEYKFIAYTWIYKLSQNEKAVCGLIWEISAL